jgi:hypothetical protein
LKQSHSCVIKQDIKELTIVRKRQKIHHQKSILGHSYHVDTADGPYELANGLSEDWTQLAGRVSENYYWFRAPTITLAQLADTVQCLHSMSGKFELALWADGDKFDASLKVTDELDAAAWAWSFAHFWAKWSPEQEKEFQAAKKSKPKLRVGKNGTVKVKVQVSTIED